eukprot:2098886-Amphidinium_carterae.1
MTCFELVSDLPRCVLLDRALGAKSLDEFAKIAGVSDSEEVAELRRLFELVLPHDLVAIVRPLTLS